MSDFFEEIGHQGGGGCRELFGTHCEVNANIELQFDTGYSSATHSPGLRLDNISELDDIEDYRL